jgi:hypothetical protein
MQLLGGRKRLARGEVVVEGFEVIGKGKMDLICAA